MCHPNSLFEQTLCFICRNICHVESLRGIPELIGERIASSVSDGKIFSTLDRKVFECIRLFVNEYKFPVIRSLCLKSCPVMSQQPSRFGNIHTKLFQESRNWLREVINLGSLAHLDLSFCSLCKEQEWLTSIGALKLTKLALRGIGMKDEDIRILLSCATIRKSGLYSLEELNISENPVSKKSLPKLESLDFLKMLIATDTLIKKEHILRNVWFLGPDDMELHITNEGWFSPMLCDLAMDVTKLSKFYAASSHKEIRNNLVLCRVRVTTVTKRASCDLADHPPSNSKKQRLDFEKQLLAFYK